jgi:hypothetical protein
MKVVVSRLLVEVGLLLICSIKVMSHSKIAGSLQAGSRVTLLTSWVMEAAKVWGKERTEPCFNAVGEKERHGLDRVVEASVVGKCEHQNIELPSPGRTHPQMPSSTLQCSCYRPWLDCCTVGSS